MGMNGEGYTEIQRSNSAVEKKYDVKVLGQTLSRIRKNDLSTGVGRVARNSALNPLMIRHLFRFFHILGVYLETSRDQGDSVLRGKGIGWGRIA